MKKRLERDNRRQSASTWTWLDDVTNLRYRSPCNIRIYLCLEVVVMVKNPGMRLSWSGHAQTPMTKSLLRDRYPGKNAKGMWWQRPELLPWSRAIWSIRSQKCLKGTSLYPGFHLTRGALKQLLLSCWSTYSVVTCVADLENSYPSLYNFPTSSID